MSVIIKDAAENSVAYNAGIRAGDTLVSVNGREIMDVLDYRFCENESHAVLSVIKPSGEMLDYTVDKAEYDEFGLSFDTYLMDKQHSCKNKCVFCFIDQLPKGMRDSLYFKDDDSRLSFLFGNYITLTNITEHEVERIISMHISPVNISVHTTDPELRVKMMKNKNAGKALDVLYKLASNGIAINCQLVLCPGYNDGEALKKTLADLLALDSVQCIAAVPVGLTDHREGLEKLTPFDEESAKSVLDIIEDFGNISYNKCNRRRVFASDEFYLLAKREIPQYEYYEDFDQLENGIGLWALMLKEATDAVTQCNRGIFARRRKITLVTGVAAAPLMKKIAGMCNKKFRRFECDVHPVVNDFFGHKITVAGLVTGHDIINQLKGKDLGDEVLFPAVMLRSERDRFLDDVTVAELEKALGVKCTPVENNGYALVSAMKGR